MIYPDTIIQLTKGVVPEVQGLDRWRWPLALRCRCALEYTQSYKAVPYSWHRLDGMHEGHRSRCKSGMKLCAKHIGSYA